MRLLKLIAGTLLFIAVFPFVIIGIKLFDLIFYTRIKLGFKPKSQEFINNTPKHKWGVGGS